MIKKIALWALLFIVAAFISLIAASVGAAPSERPLFDDPTPTPADAFYWVKVADSSATHDGDAGITYGNNVDVPGYEDAQAVVRSHEKDCPLGTNNHWAKGRYDDNGAGWVSAGFQQTCDLAPDMIWWWMDNGQTVGDTEDEVTDEFPTLTNHSGVNTVGETQTDWQAFTEAGGPGDAGYISHLQVWYLIYGPYECNDVLPEDREALSTGLLIGTDEVGEIFDLVEGQEYMLYTNEGPWNDSVDDRYDAALRFYDPGIETWGEWVTLDSFESDPICDDSFLDANGAVILFEAESDQSQIQFRVNDVTDEFEDNTGDLEYYWLGGEGTGQGCETGWTKGSLAGSLTVDATDDDYQYLQPNYIMNGLYALTVTGSYTDDGVASNDIRIADYPTLATGNHDNWADYNTWTGTDTCTGSDTDTLKEYYGAARMDFYDLDLTYDFGQAKPLSIVDDGDANYANNAGTILVEIHEAEYVPPPADCATKYEIGTYIETPLIFADNSNGLGYPSIGSGLTVGQVYYLSNEGNPYDLDGTLSYDFEIRWDSESSWSDPEVFFDCISPVDADRNGHYFVAEETTLWLRAEHTLSGYAANTGSIVFNLHGATNKIVPDDEDCSDYFSLDKIRWRGSIAADNTAGYSIDYSVFDPGAEYAIIISGAYTDPDGTGKTGEIRRSAPNMGAVEYDSFENFTGAMCYEQIDGYDIVYFTAAELSDYEVRATEPGGGNTGTMDFEVWELERLQDPEQGCEMRDYGDVQFWYILKQDEEIYASNPGVDADGVVTGHLLASAFDPDTRYRMDTKSCWGFPGLENNCDIEISPDGGGTWIGFQDWVSCYVEVGDFHRGLWYGDQVQGPGPYLLRVYDSGFYFDNVGSVFWDMWTDNEEIDPGDIYDDDYFIEGWGAGCTAVCAAPGWLEIGQWVEYARCRLTRWLAWCPWHAKALKDMEEDFYGIEPFGTMFELINLGRTVKSEIDTYSWTDEGGGGDGEVPEVSAPRHFIFAPGEGGGAEIPLVGEGTIWGSGEIDLNPNNPANQRDYSTECNNLLAESLGSRLATPMCFSMNVIDQLGLLTWFQWMWDMFMVVGLLLYVKNNWVDPNS